MDVTLTMHRPNLALVELRGHIGAEDAERFFKEAYAMLEHCTQPLHLVVDGRALRGASAEARRLMEQIIKHPRMGHIAIVVGRIQALLIRPFMRSVKGVDIFSNQTEAISFLEEQNMVIEEQLLERIVGA